MAIQFDRNYTQDISTEDRTTDNEIIETGLLLFLDRSLANIKTRAKAGCTSDVKRGLANCDRIVDLIAAHKKNVW